MAYGDHLSVQCVCFTHHCIDVGDGTVIEYGGKGSTTMVIRRVPFQDFARRGKVDVVGYPLGATFPPEEVVRRAFARMREQRYDLFENNCEHFAYWCKTGQQYSPQANDLKGGVTAFVVVGLFALAANG